MFARGIVKDESVKENTKIDSEYQIKIMSAFLKEIQLPVAELCGLETIMETIPPGDKVYKYAQAINKCGILMANIITNIKLYYELKSDMYESPLSCFSFRNEIGKIWQDFMNKSDELITSKTIEFKGDISCSMTLDKDVPSGMIGLDLKLFHILMNNILQNSYIYTSEGNIDLNIFAKKKHKYLYTMSIRIKDTGEGIENSEIEHVFDPFVKSSKSSSGCGPGLGLSVSREICRFLDGDLIIEESVPSRGTTILCTFDFTIQGISPHETYSEMRLEGIKSKKTKKRPSIEEENEGRSILSDASKPKKILLVEDSKVIHKLITSFLRDDKFDVVCKYNGKEAVETCKEVKYDIILMDITMPVMDGFTAINLIKKVCDINFTTPIVVMTGTNLGNMGSLFHSESIVHFLTKPIKKDMLIRVISKYTDPDDGLTQKFS